MRSSDLRAVYGFLKPANDAHTIGLQTAGELLTECGYRVVIADEKVQKALSYYHDHVARTEVINWIRANQINRLGISYRLDHTDATNMLGFILEELKQQRMLKFQDGDIDLLFFGGLPQTCREVEQNFPESILAFKVEKQLVKHYL